jgi:hypothetical protein
MTLRERIAQFNESVAIGGTKVFSSMWTCYAFCVWGLLGMVPGLPKGFTDIVLLVSSAWIQLFALPLIAVGAVVLNRASEARATEDHAAILAELQEIRETHADILEQLALAKEERAVLQAIHVMLIEIRAAQALAQGPGRG